MKMLKNTIMILCVFGMVFSACGCNSNVEINIPETGAQSSDSEPTDELSQATEIEIETISTEFEISEAEPESENKWVINVEEQEPLIEENGDTELAKQFSIDFIKSYALRDTSMIDFDKYIDNVYLKEYAKDNLFFTLSFFPDEPLPFEEDLLIRVRDSEEVDGINYVNIDFDFYTPKAHRQITNHGGSIIGIRDGRVVNIISMKAYYSFQHLIYGWPYKAGDSIYKPNPWDDEKVAQRAVKAFKKYADGEYPYFQAAWENEYE